MVALAFADSNLMLTFQTVTNEPCIPQNGAFGLQQNELPNILSPIEIQQQRIQKAKLLSPRKCQVTLERTP